MTLLVAGGDRVDAGKTTFTAGLVSHTGAVGFKPRAGNDYWFHHDDVRHAVDGGRLFGKDAKTLAATSPGTLAPEDVNPVHRLWQPAPGPDQGLLGQDDREFLVDRAGGQFVVNGTRDIPEPVRSNLDLSGARTVDTLEELNRAMEQLHLPALGDFAETVTTTDHAVVESYSDIARPLRDIVPDAVAVIEPHRARVYDGERYWRACEVASRSPHEGQLEERVGGVVDLVEPEASVRLPALSSDERADPGRVANVYDHAYERLLAVAEDGGY
jgi:predicted P-loop ATPase/GTPase